MQTDISSIKHTIELFEPLIITNEKKTFIRPIDLQESYGFSRLLFMKLCHLPVIDKESLKMIQVLKLHDAINFTESIIGSATLLRSLIQPSTDLQYIQAKQEALREIKTNNLLCQALQDVVHEFSIMEVSLFKFFNKGLIAMFPYTDFKKAKKASVSIVKILQKIPNVESSYLQALISYIQSYKNSSIYEMMNGKIYKTFKGLESAQNVSIFIPKQEFIPHRFTKWLLAGPAIILAPYMWNMFGFNQSLSPQMLHIGLAWTALVAFYCLFVKPVRDTGEFIEPFRKKCINDPIYSRAIDAIGMIDELLSFVRFSEKYSHPSTLPTITDHRYHSFEATGLTNPVLAKDNSNFVPNHINLSGVRLTFISGPNSGGKTTICKSIVHNQLLAQIGSYVCAETATINIADKISYQAPTFDSLLDQEGRFGVELSRTRDIFFSTTPKSLVILDELAEGTTYEERLQVSSEILNDFYTIGNNTILVTHNHSLVDKFMQEKRGQCLMVEFQNDLPTYRLIPGISRESHADRIAKKINFSKEDRYRYLKEKGYHSVV